MTLPRKSIHVRLAPEQHDQLVVLAELAEKDLAALAAGLLEKAIAGEWHVIQRTKARMDALGKMRD